MAVITQREGGFAGGASSRCSFACRRAARPDSGPEIFTIELSWTRHLQSTWWWSRRALELKEIAWVRAQFFCFSFVAFVSIRERVTAASSAVQGPL